MNGTELSIFFIHVCSFFSTLYFVNWSHYSFFLSRDNLEFSLYSYHSLPFPKNSICVLLAIFPLLFSFFQPEFWLSFFFAGGYQQCFNSFTSLLSLFPFIHSIVKVQFSSKNHFVTLLSKILLYHSLAFILQGLFFFFFSNSSGGNVCLMHPPGCGPPIYTYSMPSASFVLLSPSPGPSHLALLPSSIWPSVRRSMW